MPRPIDTDVVHHWRRISREKEGDRPRITGDIEADVAIIGGGFTALSAALEFCEAGARVVVLEQYRIGQGASGRNNGQVIPQHSKASPGEMKALLGARRGEAYNRLVAGAADEAFRRIERYAIACDGVQQGWIQAAHSEAALNRARTFVTEWQALGARVELLSAEEMAHRTGTKNYRGGWQAATGGHVNPYALALGLARAAEARGATIYENTAVTAAMPDAAGWLVTCATGRVRARKLLVATNGLTGTFWPKLAQAMIPVRVFQAATAPVSSNLRGAILANNQAMSDTRRDIRAYRFDARGSLVSGGTHTFWQDADARGREKVARHIRATFPELEQTPIAEYWEGILAVVPDRVPRIMRLGDNAVFAGVYSGRGVAMSQAVGALAARLLTDAVSEDDSPVPVTPLRLVPSHGFAVQVARFIHPYHRIRDRLDK